MSNQSEWLTISDAARRLKVSERTIYRMLKAGKLTRHYHYDTVRIMSSEIESLNSLRIPVLSDSVSQMSVTVSDPLEKLIAEKDAQIAQLLAQQREMSQMLERFQEQLYELTRFVLSQAKNPPPRGFDWAFWRRGRRTDNASSGEKT